MSTAERWATRVQSRPRCRDSLNINFLVVPQVLLGFQVSQAARHKPRTPFLVCLSACLAGTSLHGDQLAREAKFVPLPDHVQCLSRTFPRDRHQRSVDRSAKHDKAERYDAGRQGWAYTNRQRKGSIASAAKVLQARSNGRVHIFEALLSCPPYEPQSLALVGPRTTPTTDPCHSGPAIRQRLARPGGRPVRPARQVS